MFSIAVVFIAIVNSYTIKFTNGWNDRGSGAYNFSASSDGDGVGKQPTKLVQKEQYNFQANKTEFRANGTLLSVIPPHATTQHKVQGRSAPVEDPSDPLNEYLKYINM